MSNEEILPPTNDYTSSASGQENSIETSHPPTLIQENGNTNVQVSTSLRGCSIILSQLMRHKYAWIFNQPVDVEKLKIPHYHTIIKNPMDFGTIKSKLENDSYTCSEFAKDVRLVFSNATTFNPPQYDAHKMAVTLSKMFEDRFSKLTPDGKDFIASSKKGKSHSSHKRKQPSSSLAKKIEKKPTLIKPGQHTSTDSGTSKSTEPGIIVPVPLVRSVSAPVGEQTPTLSSSSVGQRTIKKSRFYNDDNEPINLSSSLKRCSLLLAHLMRHKYAWVYNRPVDVEKLKIPTYNIIIKHPMDLGTIKQKLEQGKYNTMNEFAEDVRLTFNNSKKFNPPTNDVHQMAIILEDFFEERFAVLNEKEKSQSNIPGTPKMSTVTKNKTPQPNQYTFKSKTPKPSQSQKKLQHSSSTSSITKFSHQKQFKNISSPKPFERNYSDIQSMTTPRPDSSGDTDPARSSRSSRSIRRPRFFIHEDHEAPRLSLPLRRCSQLLSHIMRHKYCWVFNQPVDVEKLKIPHYNTIIKKPMDLGTVKTKLENGIYGTPQEFYADVQLVWNNAKKFNNPQHDIHKMADTLSEIFDERYSKINLNETSQPLTPQMYSGILPPSSSAVYRKQQARITPAHPKTFKNVTKQLDFSQDTLSKMQEMQSQIEELKKMISSGVPASVNRKGNVIDDNAPLTYSEKKTLKKGISQLPEQDLPGVVDILSRNMPNKFGADEDVEIDIDQVDTSVLRQLQRYVKTVMSRIKRKRQRSTPTTPLRSLATPSPFFPPSRSESRADSTGITGHSNQSAAISSTEMNKDELSSESSDNDDDSDIERDNNNDFHRITSSNALSQGAKGSNNTSNTPILPLLSTQTHMNTDINKTIGSGSFSTSLHETSKKTNSTEVDNAELWADMPTRASNIKSVADQSTLSDINQSRGNLWSDFQVKKNMNEQRVKERQIEEEKIKQEQIAEEQKRLYDVEKHRKDMDRSLREKEESEKLERLRQLEIQREAARKDRGSLAMLADDQQRNVMLAFESTMKKH